MQSLVNILKNGPNNAAESINLVARHIQNSVNYKHQLKIILQTCCHKILVKHLEECFKSTFHPTVRQVNEKTKYLLVNFQYFIGSDDDTYIIRLKF